MTTTTLKRPVEQAENLKSAIVTLLNRNQEIGMKCDLSCYPTHDGLYQVDYILCEETVDSLNLTDKERKSLMDEEELVEIFDNAEDAAEFYIRISGGRSDICSDPAHGRGHGATKKRTFKEKSTSYEKDKYF
jgi:hypothetical protein